MRREPNSQESCIPKRGKREEANEVLNMHMLNVHMHTLLKSCVTTFENIDLIDGILIVRSFIHMRTKKRHSAPRGREEGCCLKH